MNCVEFGSSDENVPAEFESLEWKEVVDPDFELLQMSLLEDDDSPETLYSCPVCGMEVTEFELDINGACPGCDTKRNNDVPF